MPNTSVKTVQNSDLESVKTSRVMQSRFLIFHIMFLGAAFWVPVTMETALWGVGLYFLRMFGITGGYHRYFSHRAFKTSRPFAFILAFLAQSSAQRGVLWWASNHRHHHKHSDEPEDLHSPVQEGFWMSHCGWLFRPKSFVKRNNIADFERFPELVWLDRNPIFPAFVLAIACLLTLGWSGLVYSFGWSTIALFHGTFTINSLSHVWGKRRYQTKDDSRNNVWLALITMGEGWHNNHHHYMASARQGFFWWEIDITWYILKVLSWMHIVSDLRTVPDGIRMKHQRANPRPRKAV